MKDRTLVFLLVTIIAGNLYHLRTVNELSKANEKIVKLEADQELLLATIEAMRPMAHKASDSKAGTSVMNPFVADYGGYQLFGDTKWLNE